MSYHPYSNVKNRHAGSRARCASKSTNHTALNPGPAQSSSAAVSTAVRDQSSACSNVHGLTSHEEIIREADDAEVAWRQGRITISEYGDVLRSCLAKRGARLDRLKIATERVQRGEDSGIQELMGYTDGEMKVKREKARRSVMVELENEQRSRARMLRRTITRGL